MPAKKRAAKARPPADINPTISTVGGDTFRVTVPRGGSTDDLFRAVEAAHGVAVDRQGLAI